MATHRAHTSWLTAHLDSCDNWLSPAIQYEDQPDELEMSDRHYRGIGPQHGLCPQDAATEEQAASMELGWQRLLDKARRDIEAMEARTYDDRIRPVWVGLYSPDSDLEL